MAIELTDVVERIVSTLENSTSGDFSNIRGKLYEKAKLIELELNTGATAGMDGTSGAPQPLPHTLASFVWSQNSAQQTPLSQPYTFPVLRPIASGCLIEAFVEVGIAASGADTLFEFFKNNTKFGEVTLPAGETTALVAISGTLADREFTRDDFFAFKITEATSQRARFLTVYLRFFQYPYIMADHQGTLPVPA
jgi:hypothetical protein